MATVSINMNDNNSLTNGNSPLTQSHAPLSNGIDMEHGGGKTSPEPIPIAIIGMACRTPGNVSNPEELWELCSQRRSGWSKVPGSRFNHEAFYHPNPSKFGCMNPQGAHFLQDDISHFDNSFFRITDKEASSIDPQQRILLECAYEAIESASVSLDALAGKDVGVFAAQSFSEYAVQLFRDPETIPMFKATGCSDALMSNRISYAFDLRGPSMTVDTACSSSLTALHLACQSLRAGESTMAIAGGCHVNLTPDDFISFSMSNLLSDNGKSMAFDHRATGGFGRGEGVGCLILKPLDAAIRDGDKIRSIIRNSGINQDGKTVGITMPNPDAQESLARSVYRSAGLDPLDTQYVECHGTGTAVGDPIEAAALGAVLGRPAESKKPLYIGSIKSNIGHLEGASGVVAIIKAALMLEKGFLLPNCDFQMPNPAIPFDSWNMKITPKQILWPRGKTRRASVNNFGFGGSNAHFILEQAPKMEKFSIHDAVLANNGTYQHQISEMVVPKGDLGQSRRLIILSASSEAGVKAQAKSLSHYLKHRPEVLYRSIFSSLALTLQRRSLFQWRVAISATSQAETFEALDERGIAPVRSTREPRIGFVFTGQGAQWYAMGRELMHTYPVYAESLLLANDILAAHGCEWSLIDELSKDKVSSRLDNAYLAQPSCTALQLALVDLLDSWHIRPVGVVGHSSGEIAAAYAAKAISFEAAMVLAYYRGTAATRLMYDYPGTKGAMLAIGGQMSEIDGLVKNHNISGVVRACYNSPASFTMSGDQHAIEKLDKAASGIGLFSRKLKTEIAYHSHHMALVADYYHSCIEGLTTSTEGQVSFHSSLLGQQTNASHLGPDYWVNNLKSPVLFSAALESMCITEKPDVLLELGPHTALQGPIRETLLHMKPSVNPPPEYLPCLIRFEDSVASMLDTTARLVVKGANLNVTALNFPTKDPRQPIILTDLDTYAWDHSKNHWYESRIAQGYRLRKGARNDILGVLAADSNDVEPRWRNVIKIEDAPWLEHHKVQGNIVYPMSGFIAMAVEAMKARAESRNLDVERYSLQEIHSSRPLVVPTDRHVETMLTLRPYNESAVGSSDKWDEFRILSFTTSDQGWSEHCRGLVSAESSTTQNAKQALVAKIEQACTTEVKPSGLYDMLGKMGVQYGSLFTGVESLAAGLDCATGAFRIPDTAATMPYRFETEHVIHPATLDLCFQFIWPSVVGPSLNLKALYVPTSIRAIAISSQTPKIPGTKVNVSGCRTSSHRTSKKMAASLLLKQNDSNGSESAIEIDDLTLTRIAEEEIWQRESTLAFKLEYKPDVDFTNAEQFQTFPSTLAAVTEEALEEPLALEQASLVYFRKALSQVSSSQIDEKQPYLQQFYQWMTHVCDLGQGSSTLLNNRQSPKMASDDDFLERVAGLYGSRSELTCSMGRSLPAILRGEIDPLSVLLEGNLLSEYYSTQDCITRSYHHACQYVDLIAHQNPALKVLEIGAGTGGATFPILKTLGGYEGKNPRLLLYDYTDISSGFFDAAKERFAPWNAFLRYRVLDVEKDLGEQGFDGESYDVIVAANVLHATSLLTTTMTNVYKLLKPGGKLILIEETIPAIRRFPFAALPGWWLSQEPERRDGPLISETQWEKLLRDTGFTGLDVCLQDYPSDPAHTSSTMLSTAGARPEVGELGEILFTSSEGREEDPTKDFEHSFRNVARLRSSGVCPIDNAMSQQLQSTTCIFIDDPEKPFLAAITRARLDQVKRLFQAKALIWVTRAALQSSNGPGTSLINGLARSVRSENAATKIVTLHCSDVGNSKLVQLLSQIYRKIHSSDSAEVDFEYMEHDGMLAVPRACECAEVEDTIVKYGRLPQPKSQPFIQPDRLLTLKHGTTGVLSELYFDDQNITLSDALDDNEVQIGIKAMGVNFKDVVVALGQVDGYLGHDCSGIVTAIGSKVTNVSVGDRVCALARETFSTTLECNALSTVRIPDAMSFTEAASIPAVFCTAYYSLINLARLQAGESVLIHAAAGGVGQAAIMISQMIGAEIYVTVGSDWKKEHLITTYGVPRDHILNSRTAAFAQELRELTHQRGVDVVLNSLGGELLRVTWDTLAKYGRFVELGKLDIERNSRLDMATFSKSTTFASVDLEMLREDKQAMMQEMLVDIIDMFHHKKLKQITPINVLPIDALGSALNDMQRGKAMGKTVIEPLPGQEIQAMPPVTKHPSIRSDGTYLITGGMGGLGRSMTKWLVQQGATSIALLSRSGHTSANAKIMKDEYLSTGINVSVLQCDVADEEQVRTVIDYCSTSMPPIRGIIHGAMVLHDKLFDNTTISDYSAILAPKVDGAWNLHNLAPPLDFFVSLASAAGILGTRGQSVYAGTSTFLGAFARWRQSQGLPANTIYLGAVAEVGYVAERSDRQGAISSTYGDKGLTEREFLAFIRASIENQHSIPEIYTSLALASGTSSFIYWAGDAKFAHLRRQALASQSTAPVAADDQAPRSLAQLLAGVESLGEAQAMVSRKLKAKMCSLLMVPEEDIDETKAVVTYGLDSLVAVEFRNWIVKEAGAGIQLMDLMTSRSFGDLAALVTKRSSLVEGKKFAEVDGAE